MTLTLTYHSFYMCVFMAVSLIQACVLVSFYIWEPKNDKQTRREGFWLHQKGIFAMIYYILG